MPVTATTIVAARRLKVMELQRRGIMAPAVIAERLGATLSTIRADIQVINRQVAEEVRKTIRDVHIGRQLHRLNHLYQEAGDAWERSKQPEESMVAKVRKRPGKHAGPDGQPVIQEETSTEQRRRGQVGDPSFLHVQLSVCEREANLLGLDALPDAQRRAAQVAAVRGVMDIVRMVEARESAEIIDVPLADGALPALPAPGTSASVPTPVIKDEDGLVVDVDLPEEDAANGIADDAAD